jgi:hypothetical protein
VQHLARDAADVTELQVEVTWARAVTIMAEAQSAWAERRAQESAISLAFARGEADEVAQKATLLDGELAVAR